MPEGMGYFSLLDDGATVAWQQQLAMGPPRRDAVGHDALVELAQVEGLAARDLYITPQLERGEFAEKVATVGRIVRAPDRLLTRGRRRQVRLGLEQLRRAIDRPLAAVQSQT